MTTLNFTKMHGLGNDFIVINALNQPVEWTADNIKSWSDRHTGIGFDQLLLIEASENERCDFKYRIFNADGGEVEQCGNGARCFAKYVTEHGLTDKTSVMVETMRGIIVLNVLADGQITVDMGKPHFAPEEIPQKQSRTRCQSAHAGGGHGNRARELGEHGQSACGDVGGRRGQSACASVG